MSSITIETNLNQQFNDLKVNECYLVQPSELQELATQLCAGNLAGLITNLFKDTMTYIASIRLYPCDLADYFGLEGYSQVGMKLGTSNITGVNAILMRTATSSTPARTSVKMCDINITASDFSDYEPYSSYTLYLPYCKFYEIPANILLNNVLRIYYSIDICTGKLAVDIIIVKNYGTDDEEEYCYDRLDGTIGIEYPVVNTNTAQAIKNFGTGMVKAGTSAIGGAVAGGLYGGEAGIWLGAATGFASGTANALQQLSFRGNTREIGEDFLKWILPQHPYIIKRKLKIVNFDTGTGYFDSAYLRLKGQSSEAVTTLRNLSGFIKVKEIHLDDLTRATKPELIEIERLLKEGVIM